MALPGWTGRYTVRRRLIQLGFLAVFALLPLFDLLRFDFVEGRLHVFRSEVWMDEWTLIWLALMFAMWVIGAVSLVLGRVFCAYSCPQMVFSELAHDVDALSDRLVKKVDARRRKRAAKAVSTALLAVVSIVASALFMGYFAPIGEVLRRIVRLDVGLWVGAVGAVTTLVAFLDLVTTREVFCRSVCPYGLLQGVIEDGRSLHVAFDESTGPCIGCKACERICPMEIDIRKGAFQIECTRCGSCIDACQAILERKGRPSLLAFDLGAFSWKGWDPKRALVALSTVGFGVVFVAAVSMREMVAFHLSPRFEGSAAVRPGERVETKFLLRVANRRTRDESLDVKVEGLPPGAVVEGVSDPRLPAGKEKRFDLVVSLPRSQTKGSVTPFTLVIRAADRSERFPATFYTPGSKPS